ncbi:MAG: Rieske 2Fe-2S domain-containing protein [Polyangiales bacterium]
MPTTEKEERDEPCADVDHSRRRILTRLSLTLAAASAALLGIPVVGFVLGPFTKRVREVWRDIGPIEHFEVGKTVKVEYQDPSPLPWAGVTARTAAWLRREEGQQFTAFAINCTHLGCPVRWIDSADLFMCPCHGGVYYDDGTVAGGPPPRPLPRYPVRVQDGLVQIRTRPIPLTTFPKGKSKA